MMKFIELVFATIVSWVFVYKISKLLYNETSKKLNIKTIISIIICILLTIVLNSINSEILKGTIKILFSYTLFCLFQRIVFNKIWAKVLAGSLILYICILISEVIVAVIASLILMISNQSLEFLKNTIIINILISILAYFLVNKLKNILSNFIVNINNNKISSYIMIFLILITIALLLYIIPINRWKLTSDFIATMIILLSFLIVGLYLMKQNSDIQKTLSKYQHLAKSASITSNVLKEYKIVNHEHKNQLSIIRQMSNNQNQKLIEYLDSLIDKKNNIKYKWVGDISYINLEGLNALLNYKLAQMEDEKINVCVSVSKEIEKVKFNRLTSKQEDNLYSLIGVYLDNAIEAAVESKKKEVNIVIYKENNDIVFQISNTYNGTIDISKVDEYDYSTKGKNHGVGLSIVKRIIEEESIYSQSRKLIDNYYFQELRINLSKLTKKKRKTT